MNDIFNNIQNILIMYLPTLFLAINQIVEWRIMCKNFKTLDVQNQVRPLMNRCNAVLDEVKELKATIKQFNDEKMDLAAQVINLTSEVHEQCALNIEMKGFMQKLSQENIELKAALRRKVSCGAIEPEPV